MAAKWWGWGAEDRRATLESRPGLLAFLADRIGPLPEEPLRVPALASVRLPPVRLSDAELAAFRGVVGDGNAVASQAERVSHAVGKSYRDLLRLRLGSLAAAPDVVVYPDSEDAIRAILARCADHGFAVVPFGGGTSVVGGVEASDPSRQHVTLDLRHMDAVLAVDEVSHTATAEAGISGPVFEAALAAKRLTLGHEPQSFEFSTLGGWIATRSAGALSNRYGKIEDLVAGLRLLAPSGTLDLRGRPRHAMGSDLLALAVGSEGTLGVIAQATVRVHPAPDVRRHASYLFRSFGEGLEALRSLAQGGMPPSMTYLFDEDETRLLVASAGRGKGASTLLRARGVKLDGASLLLCGFEGSKDTVWAHKEFARARCRRGVSVGPSPAERYVQDRFEAPYLRDALIERRILVDTLETATVWSNLERLHRAVRDTISDALGARSHVGCHVSHVYTEGASLYFTFFAVQTRGEEFAQYDRVKAVATRAILDHGGHLSHHHGIGTEHARYWREAIGEEAFRVLRDLKRSLDPNNIMNPGKLFPVSA